MAEILIVDDEANVADVVALVLEGAGHMIARAISLEGAKSSLDKKSFDGAIVDVWLGSDDGLELATLLSTQDPILPFVIMSGGGRGRSLETVTARADALGAAAVLFKPFDDDELLDAVDNMLGRRPT